MTNPHYWCTWRTQNALSRQKEGESSSPLLFAGDQGAKLARAMLNEDLLFGENGMAYQFEDFRDQLFFMLDDGWDVAYDTHPDVNRHLFSSLILNSERFPSFTGEPWERLQKLNKRLQEIGWRGLGIWVACQNYNEKSEGPFVTLQEEQAFWSQRLSWCDKANIPYMKVDWGARCEDVAYRHEMTRLAHQYAPSMLLEHARPCRPMNDVLQSNSYSSWLPVRTAFTEIASFSDVFRIYDTAPQLSVPTTLDRCAQLLQDLSADSTTLLNCEDEMYVGTGLGLCVAPMRSPLSTIENTRKDPTHVNRRILEIKRALHWFALAPAFHNKASRNHKLLTSSNYLADKWDFISGDFWWSDLNNQTVTQSAPAICARNLPLPCVTNPGQSTPYIAACRYPNGMTSISFLPHIGENSSCNATVQALASVGVFGTFNRLTVLCCIPENPCLMLRDLAQDTSVEITAAVEFSEDGYTIAWDTIAQNSLVVAGDCSETGCLLTLKNAE